MIIYQILQNEYYGGTIEIPDDSIGIPLWTTRTAPPPIPEGSYAIWNGAGWSLTQNPPPVIQPEEPPQPIPITPELIELQNEIVQQVQDRLDTFARLKNYDGILSVCTYLNDPNPVFAADAEYCFQKRSETWTKIYSIFNDVLYARRPIPSGYDEIEPELPVLQW